MTRHLTTLLFDLDGTLINTNELIVSSFLHTLNHYYPNQYKREDVYPFLGPPLAETFEKINPERAEEMILRYRKFNVENHDLLVTEFNGVYEVIRTLKENQFQLAIVSTKMRDLIIRGLKLTRLEPFFDTIVSLDDVNHAKPHPEPILKALERLGAKPEEAMMIGDNYHDIQGGKNAGTLTAGVSWSLKGKEYLMAYHPDYMLDSMFDLLPIVGVGVS
jgi:pyrophosphatase PpaX